MPIHRAFGNITDAKKEDSEAGLCGFINQIQNIELSLRLPALSITRKKDICIPHGKKKRRPQVLRLFCQPHIIWERI